MPRSINAAEDLRNRFEPTRAFVGVDRAVELGSKEARPGSARPCVDRDRRPLAPADGSRRPATVNATAKRPLMNPEVRLLRYFLAVAEELNFTRAAERIGVAQPALSAQIRQLEAQLGLKLFERSTRSVALTEAGHAVLERGPAALASLQEVWETARRVGRGELGRVKVAYSPSAGYEIAPRLVEAVGDRYPGLEISARVRSSTEVVQHVLDGAVDVGIARTSAACEGLRLRTVRLERQGVLVAAGHPLARTRPIELEQAASFPILLHERAANPEHYDLVLELFRRPGVDVRIITPLLAFDPAHRIIRDGHAVALVGESITEGMPAPLRWLPLTEPDLVLPVQLVLRDGEPSPLVDRFERVALATAARLGWLRARPSALEPQALTR